MLPRSSIGYSPRRMRRACSGNQGARHVIGTRLPQVADVSSAILSGVMRTALCVAPAAGNTSLYPFREMSAINGQRVLQPERTYAADRMSGCIDHFIAAQHTGFCAESGFKLLIIQAGIAFRDHQDNGVFYFKRERLSYLPWPLRCALWLPVRQSAVL
ncbi:Uncharacterised protein [Salmonella enterica subsp. enterica]|uniref:Uncharacterized protein n=1 Tax=Salmonella enterica I TaxID=59201 RepID=A0A447TN82_SALET|nr:Uncharacterised protein [Salmonella enterica subsp. enterica]